MANPNWLNLLPDVLHARLRERRSLMLMLQNSGWLFLDKAVRLALGLVVGAWVARYLGPKQFGELAYVLAYLAFFHAVATLRIDGIVVRDIAHDAASANTVLGTAFVLRLVVGSLCWMSAVGCMIWLYGLKDQNVALTALAGGALVFQAADAVDLWFQSQSRSRRTVIAKLIVQIFSSGMKLFLIWVNAPLLAFAAVFMLDALVAAIALGLAYRRFSCERQWKYASAAAKHMLCECWPHVLSGISVMIYMRIDQIMINDLLGAESLGVYAAMLSLATLWQFVPLALNVSLAPFVAKRKAQGEDAYWDALQKIFRMYALLGWLVCILTVICASSLTSLLYGQQYQQGVTALSIYVFTNVFINMGLAQELWLLNERRPVTGLLKTTLGAAVCVIGNLLVIPEYGIAGAAFVSVVAMASSAVLSNLLFARRIFTLQMRSLFLLGGRGR